MSGVSAGARVRELTPLGRRDKWLAGCGALPVYSNLTLVDEVLSELWASWRRRESPLQDVACEHFVSGVPSTGCGQRPLWKLQKCNRENRA